MVKWFKKLQDVFFRPSVFFKRVEKEKEYPKVLFFYVIVAIIVGIFSMIVSIPVYIKMGSAIFALFAVLMGVIGTVIGAFIMPFIVSAFNHLGVLVVGGREGFFNTFKPSTYAALIPLIYSPVYAVIGLLLELIFPVVQPIGATTMPWGNFVIRMIIGGVIGLIIIVHSLIVEVIGLSHYQKISKGRALLAALFVPLVILVLVLVAAAIIALISFAF